MFDILGFFFLLVKMALIRFYLMTEFSQIKSYFLKESFKLNRIVKFDGFLTEIDARTLLRHIYNHINTDHSLK